MGRQSRSNTVSGLLPRASSAARVAVRLGSALSPVPVIQNTRAARTASRSSSSAAISRSGAFGYR